MQWKYISRVLDGTIPPLGSKPSCPDSVLSQEVASLMERVENHFRNETEMEATVCVFLFVLEALYGTVVRVQLQPSLPLHPTFYFIISDVEMNPLCLIEVKNSDTTARMRENDTTAQVLRSAQIALSGSERIELPSVLTNSLYWSFGLVKKHGKLIKLVKWFHIELDSSSNNLIGCLRSVIQGNGQTSADLLCLL